MFKSKAKICFQLGLKKIKSIETFLFRFVFWHHLSSLPKCLNSFLCFRFYCLFRLFFAHLCRNALKMSFFFRSVFQTNNSKQWHKGSLKLTPCCTHCHLSLFRGLTSIIGKTPRDLPGTGRTVEKWFISLDICDPLWFWGFLFCFLLPCLITDGLSHAAAGWRAGVEPCISLHFTRDGSGCCF